MQLLAQEEYGLRCLIALARARGGAPLTIHEVAAEEGLSPEYAAKLLAALRRAGLVASTRGAAGGYRLARDAAGLTAWDVVAALGGALFPETFCDCHAGARSEGCVHRSACALRALWRRADAAVRTVLAGVTLADLAGREERLPAPPAFSAALAAAAEAAPLAAAVAPPPIEAAAAAPPIEAAAPSGRRDAWPG
jgi:Rrf2 family protein